MNETIYAIAAALVSPADEERDLLEMLCGIEERAVAARLSGCTEECREALLCAAAFLAAAALLDSRGGAERFTVGDVSVSGGSGGAALREQAAALLAPFDGGGFVFVGVDG